MAGRRVERVQRWAESVRRMDRQFLLDQQPIESQLHLGCDKSTSCQATRRKRAGREVRSPSGPHPAAGLYPPVAFAGRSTRQVRGARTRQYDTRTIDTEWQRDTRSTRAAALDLRGVARGTESKWHFLDSMASLNSRMQGRPHKTIYIYTIII